MESPAAFIRVWLLVVVLAVAGAGAVNAVIDPYDMLGMPRHAGLNAIKPRARDHVVQVKTYQIERFQPVTVVLGGSRAHIGIATHTDAWPAAMRPVFNYGIPGFYTTVTLGNLRHAAATGRLRYVVAMLNFQDFLEPGGPLGRNEEGERRLILTADAKPNPERWMTRASDVLLSLFTLGTLQDSLVTVARQHGTNVLDLRTDGSSTDADFASAARADGMHDLFAQKHDQEVPRVAAVAAAGTDPHVPTPHLDRLAAMIAFCRAHDIALTLVIEPSHAELLMLYRQAGLWPRIERVKADMAALVRAQGGGAVQLWDFNGFHRYATEPVPPAGDRTTQTEWFWEPSHYKTRLGELMLRRMFDGDPTPFGDHLAP